MIAPKDFINTKKIKLLIIVGLVMVILLEIFIPRVNLSREKFNISQVTKNYKDISPRALEEKRIAWGNYIEADGAQKAYESFKTIYKSENFGIQHTMAHVIGELLFDKKGIEGLTICDNSFSFGCFHGFFGQAVSKKGVGVVSDLDKACFERYGLKGLGCPHGIGHGILSYLGDSKLLDALDLCNKLSWKEPIGGCTSGVFMEYNFNTMRDPNEVSLRPLKSDVYFPCSTLPGKYTQACYFEQADWLEKVFNNDFAKVGGICNTLSDELDKDACLRGMGQAIGPSMGFDVRRSIDACSQVPGLSSQLLCRQGAAWSFFANPNESDKAPAVCEDVNEDYKKGCLAGTDILEDIKVR